MSSTYQFFIFSMLLNKLNIYVCLLVVPFVSTYCVYPSGEEEEENVCEDQHQGKRKKKNFFLKRLKCVSSLL